MSKIVISGGTGFLGSAAAKYFSQKFDEVLILGRNKSIGESLETESISFAAVDLIDSQAINHVTKHTDHIIHSGAKSSLWGPYKEFYQSNVIGTRNIISAALKNNVSRLIHISSPSVYTQFEDQVQVSENHPLPQPLNFYAKTKKLSEDEVNKGIRQGLDAVMLRPRAIFGPGDTAIMPRLIRTAKKGIPKVGSRSPDIDATYVDNVVYAIDLCVEAKTIPSTIYNITNDDQRPIHEFIQLAFEKIGIEYKEKQLSLGFAKGLATALEKTYRSLGVQQEPILTRYGISLFTNTQTLDITKAKKELHYSPNISIEEGLDRYAHWYLKNGNN